MKKAVLLMAMFLVGELTSNEDGQDYGRNWDGGPDCGGSSECQHEHFNWGPGPGGCHDAVVGSPGANGLMMLSYYLPGANGPDH